MKYSDYLSTSSQPKNRHSSIISSQNRKSMPRIPAVCCGLLLFGLVVAHYVRWGLPFSKNKGKTCFFCFCFFTIKLIIKNECCSAQTHPVDQAALIAFWNGLTDQGRLSWNTTESLCDTVDRVFFPLKKFFFEKK